MSKYKFSKFVHFLNKNEMITIFHAINRKTIFVQKSNFEVIKDVLLWDLTTSDFENGSEISCFLNYLRKNEMVVFLRESEKFKIKILQDKILQRPCIDTMYLLLTDGCNFDCTYCFFEGSYKKTKKKDTKMTKEIAKKSIQRFASYFKQANQFTDFFPSQPSIVFYGGEPLLNLSVFFAAVKEVEKLKEKGDLPLSTLLSVNTNASLIDKDIALFCFEHNIEVDVSLDGDKEIHDLCRLWKDSKKGTFKSVIRGIEILKEVGVKVCISCTLTQDNLDDLPRIFRWFFESLKINEIGFNPMLDSFRYKVNSQKYHEKVSSAMIECFEIARTEGIYEARMMRKVKAFIERNIYDRDCCGCGKQIVVRPDGFLGVCHAYSGTGDFFLNPDDNFDPYLHPFWQEWSKRSPINMPECFDCIALTICGGGCPHNAHIRNGSIWEIDTPFCVHSKKTLEWLIWDLYKHTKT